MKSTRLIILVLLISVVSCRNNGSVENTDPTGDASATITHEDGWTIVSKQENGNPVYYFFAPDVNGVSPAMFKKIINTTDKSQPAVKTVSECEASKKTCEELDAKFRDMSKKYR